VNFPPFEEGLDAIALQEIRRYRITPFGEIQQRPENIPYNTGKRDFQSKTGREFYIVFQYNFQRPGDNTEFTVMWDYKVGLVRMTHFFKCCGYSKVR
ncbi:apses transcription factor xbp1, partial [Pseudoneurospora amorphoporcata]